MLYTNMDADVDIEITPDELTLLFINGFSLINVEVCLKQIESYFATQVFKKILKDGRTAEIRRSVIKDLKGVSWPVWELNIPSLKMYPEGEISALYSFSTSLEELIFKKLQKFEIDYERDCY